jgi:hypothetical protein
MTGLINEYYNRLNYFNSRNPIRFEPLLPAQNEIDFDVVNDIMIH